MALAAPTWAAGQERATARASALIGTPVKNVEGEELARLRDLVLDLDDQRVRYVIMEGFGKLFRYSFVNFDPGPQARYLVLHIGRERLEQSPGMEAGWQAPGLVLASALLGRDVEDGRGGKVGELADVVIDPGDGKVSHVLFRAREGGKRIARAPLSALSLRGDALVLVR